MDPKTDGSSGRLHVFRGLLWPVGPYALGSSALFERKRAALAGVSQPIWSDFVWFFVQFGRILSLGPGLW